MSKVLLYILTSGMMLASSSHSQGTVLGVAPATTVATRLLPRPRPNPVTAVPTPLLQPPAPESARLDIPVAWQLTRTRLLAPGSTTVTESFRETWILEVRPGGLIYLRSPRAVVPAYSPSHAIATGKIALPETLVLSEHDFARLVGIRNAEPDADADTDDTESSTSLDRPVTIQLGKTARKGTDVNMAWSDEEHFAVHIDVGNTSLY